MNMEGDSKRGQGANVPCIAPYGSWESPITSASSACAKTTPAESNL